MNFVNAFTFMFKEKNWVAKFLIGAVLFFFIKLISISTDFLHSDTMPKLGAEMFMGDSWTAPVALIGLYFGALLMLVASFWMQATSFGYLVTIVRRYMRGEEDIIPDWDDVMAKLFKRGLKIMLASFIFIAFLSVFAVGAYFVSSMLIFVSPFATMFAALVGLFAVVYALVLTPALFMSFCEQDRFLAAYNFVRARKFVLKAPAKYVLMLLMLLAVTIVMSISVKLLFGAKIGILVLPVVCFYLLVVKGNIIAQYYVACCKE